jgi:hypothetical protein
VFYHPHDSPSRNTTSYASRGAAFVPELMQWQAMAGQWGVILFVHECSNFYASWLSLGMGAIVDYYSSMGAMGGGGILFVHESSNFYATWLSWGGMGA